MAENKINVGGRLHSIATGNILAGADEILDDAQNKKQSVINQEVDAEFNNIITGVKPRLTKAEGDIAENREEINRKQFDVSAAVIDAVPTKNSENLVRSGAIYEAYAHQVYLSGDGTIDPASFDPQADTIHKGAQVLSDVEKKQVRANLGFGNGDVDDRPTAGSKNLVKSGGVYDVLTIQDNAISLIGDWVCPSTSTSFAESEGKNNGTFTAVSGGSLGSEEKPYFLTSNLIAGQKYRIRTKVTVNSIVRNFVTLSYQPINNNSWSALVDIYGNTVRANSGEYIDAVFVASDTKKRICITLDALQQGDTIVFEDFSIFKNTDYKDYFESKEDSENKYLDVKTNLNKVGFVGKGSIYSGHTYKGVLQKNHKYRFKVLTPSWSMPEGSGATEFKFAIRIFYADGTEREPRVADVRANDTVASEYLYTAPVGGLYFKLGGRINENSNVDVLFEDITNFTSINAELLTLKQDYDVTKVLGWPNVFNKTNAPYKARLAANGTESATGTKYVYIFPVNDYIRINAGIDNSKYTIITAIHDTFEGAKANSGATKHAFGKGLVSPSSQGGASSYRYGDSTVNSGFLMVAIYKIDGTAITDAEVTEINNGLWLDFYPLNSSKKTDNNEDAITLLEGGRLSVADFEFSAFSSDGICINDPVRAKFFKENLRPNTQFSIKINSSVFEAIPNLNWAADMYSTLEYAIGNQSDGRLQKFYNAWQTIDHADNLIINVSGVLNVYFKKSDNSSFTHSELEDLKVGVEIYVSDVSAQTEDSDEQYNELPLGQFVNQSGEYETLSDSTTIVSSPYITCVPYLGVTYKFVLPNGIRARFVYGNRNTLGSVTGWVGNDEQVVIPSNQMCQRLQFDKNGSTLTAEEITTAYNSGLIKVLYKNIDNSVKERNYDNEKYVKAALLRLGWADYSDVRAKQGLNAMPIFAHISDLHGDFKRFENCVEYAKYLGVDAIVATGDNVMYNAINGSKYLLDIINKNPGIPLVSCIGNHEVDQANTVTQEYLFNNFIFPYIAQGAYKKDANTVADNAYYYIDFANKNIRFIVLNQFDNGCYMGQGLGGRLGQGQVTWLCNTLLSTPSGYGVIIAMHANEAKVNTPQDMSNWNQTVNWDGRSEDEYGFCVNGLYVNAIRPIRTIVDAFISKDNDFSMTYNENTATGNTGETVTVSNIDFSSVAEGVEFICYFTGHRHCDNIGYVDGAVNKQLMLNVVCGNPHYSRISPLSFSEGCDLPRGDRGITQDAFNIYAIDRQNGRVKIARVGSSINFEGIERKFLIAPYKD